MKKKLLLLSGTALPLPAAILSVSHLMAGTPLTEWSAVLGALAAAGIMLMLWGVLTPPPAAGAASRS
ncbi:hypothetical protein GCM10027294_25820 [Marinactinospora endophytica]